MKKFCERIKNCVGKNLYSGRIDLYIMRSRPVFKLAGGSLRFMKIDWLLLALVSTSGPGEERSIVEHNIIKLG